MSNNGSSSSSSSSKSHSLAECKFTIVFNVICYIHGLTSIIAVSEPLDVVGSEIERQAFADFKSAIIDFKDSSPTTYQSLETFLRTLSILLSKSYADILNFDIVQAWDKTIQVMTVVMPPFHDIFLGHIPQVNDMPSGWLYVIPHYVQALFSDQFKCLDDVLKSCLEKARSDYESDAECNENMSNAIIIQRSPEILAIACDSPLLPEHLRRQTVSQSALSPSSIEFPMSMDLSLYQMASTDGEDDEEDDDSSAAGQRFYDLVAVVSAESSACSKYISHFRLSSESGSLTGYYGDQWNKLTSEGKSIVSSSDAVQGNYYRSSSSSPIPRFLLYVKRGLTDLLTRLEPFVSKAGQCRAMGDMTYALATTIDSYKEARRYYEDAINYDPSYRDMLKETLQSLDKIDSIQQSRGLEEQGDISLVNHRLKESCEYYSQASSSLAGLTSSSSSTPSSSQNSSLIGLTSLAGLTASYDERLKEKLNLVKQMSSLEMVVHCIEKAEEALKDCKYSAAKDFYAKAVKYNPNPIFTNHFNMITSYIDKTMQTLVAIQKIDDAHLAMKEGKYRLANQLFSEAIILVPDKASGLQNILDGFTPLIQCEDALIQQRAGLHAHEEKNYALAVTLLTEAINLLPFERATDLAIFYSDRAMVWQDLNEFEKALDDCSQAMALKSDYAMAHFRKGTALFSLGRYNDAIASYDKAVGYDPTLSAQVKVKLRQVNTAKEVALRKEREAERAKAKEEERKALEQLKRERAEKAAQEQAERTERQRMKDEDKLSKQLRDEAQASMSPSSVPYPDESATKVSGGDSSPASATAMSMTSSALSKDVEKQRAKELERQRAKEERAKERERLRIEKEKEKERLKQEKEALAIKQQQEKQAQLELRLRQDQEAQIAHQKEQAKIEEQKRLERLKREEKQRKKEESEKAVKEAKEARLREQQEQAKQRKRKESEDELKRRQSASQMSQLASHPTLGEHSSRLIKELLPASRQTSDEEFLSYQVTLMAEAAIGGDDLSLDSRGQSLDMGIRKGLSDPSLFSQSSGLKTDLGTHSRLFDSQLFKQQNDVDLLMTLNNYDAMSPLRGFASGLTDTTVLSSNGNSTAVEPAQSILSSSDLHRSITSESYFGRYNSFDAMGPAITTSHQQLYSPEKKISHPMVATGLDLDTLLTSIGSSRNTPYDRGDHSAVGTVNSSSSGNPSSVLGALSSSAGLVASQKNLLSANPTDSLILGAGVSDLNASAPQWNSYASSSMFSGGNESHNMLSLERGTTYPVNQSADINAAIFGPYGSNALSSYPSPYAASSSAYSGVPGLGTAPSPLPPTSLMRGNSASLQSAGFGTDMSGLMQRTASPGYSLSSSHSLLGHSKGYDSTAPPPFLHDPLVSSFVALADSDSSFLYNQGPTRSLSANLPVGAVPSGARSMTSGVNVQIVYPSTTIIPDQRFGFLAWLNKHNIYLHGYENQPSETKPAGAMAHYSHYALNLTSEVVTYFNTVKVKEFSQKSGCAMKLETTIATAVNSATSRAPSGHPLLTYLVFQHGPPGHADNQRAHKALQLVNDMLAKILMDPAATPSSASAGPSKSGSTVAPSTDSYEEFPPLAAVANRPPPSSVPTNPIAGPPSLAEDLKLGSLLSKIHSVSSNVPRQTASQNGAADVLGAGLDMPGGSAKLTFESFTGIFGGGSSNEDVNSLFGFLGSSEESSNYLVGMQDLLGSPSMFPSPNVLQTFSDPLSETHSSPYGYPSMGTAPSAPGSMKNLS